MTNVIPNKAMIRRQSSSFILHPSSFDAPAFTVTELLIVIAIIVLVLAMALPAFNFLTGSKSTEGAQNQISAFIGVARTEAIAAEKFGGVIFYLDPKTNLITLARVIQTDPPAAPLVSQADIYLALSGDANGTIFTPLESLTLPRGVGIEVVDDGGTTAASNDRYIGFNNVNGNGGIATQVSYGGVILFDPNGLLTSRSYAFIVDPTKNPPPPGPVQAMTNLMYLQPSGLMTPGITTASSVVPVNPTVSPGLVLRSQLGIALFDIEAFKNACGSDPLGDPLKDLQVVGGSYAGSFEQTTKEPWIDSNALLLLINRYNGTLVKGE